MKAIQLSQSTQVAPGPINEFNFKKEFSDVTRVQTLVKEIALIGKNSSKKWKIMEVCGGQTHSIMKYGIDQMLPPSIELLHGPGCPVCVTASQFIDKALEIAKNKKVIFTTFGDMIRVRGTTEDLLGAKALGADVRVVYSVMDAIEIAQFNPTREVVFFAIGFETTAPANAVAARLAKDLDLKNFSMLVSHVRVPPAIEAILSSPENQVQGFLAAGHVCTIMGYEEYLPIAEKYKTPIVVTGFEPLDILQGIWMLMQQLSSGRSQVLNQYTRCVTAKGNTQAIHIMSSVFEITDRAWRGMGTIPQSGLSFREEFRFLNAEIRFGIVDQNVNENTPCQIARILRGQLKPPQCELFAKVCNPENPLGATMVSAEGTCAAYYNFRLAHERNLDGKESHL